MSRAPDFDLEEAHGARVRLSDYLGAKNVLLVFHPFAFTSVCTEEALDLQANLRVFANAETEVLFVSCDTAPARQAWKRELGAGYAFASDFWSHGAAAKAYGVFNEETGAPVRGTFLIDKEGIVIWSLVKDRARAGSRSSPARSGRSNTARDTRRPRVGRSRRTTRGLPPRRHRARAPLRAARGTTRRRFHVLAPDLLGHGDSPYEPPWSIAAQLAALLESVGDAPATWLGHSFGARLAHEVAARHPELVERLVHLDPAILVPAHVALFAGENARNERVYASFEEAVAQRYEESSLQGAPRELVEAELAEHLVRTTTGDWRYRYSQAAVVAAYGELASVPPPFGQTRIPTLLVLGKHSYLSYDHLLGTHRAALGELLEVVTVDGGHTVLWDAFDETASAVEAFLA